MTALEHAYEFTKYGIPVFPITKGGKAPLTRNGFKDATTNHDQILKWSQSHPDCNWAIPTGEKSGILALDIDPRNGGLESMAELIHENGEPPKTPTVKTGGEEPGYHYYFNLPAGFDVRSGKLAKGIDIKSHGGYVIIPGSITDNSYDWIGGRDMSAIELAAIPGWILSMLQSKNDFTFDEDGFISEGNRNNYLASIGGSLRRRGASYETIEAALLAENKARCRPKLVKGEVVNIAQSMMKYEPDSDIIRGFMNNEELDLDVRGEAELSEKAIAGYLLSARIDEDFVTAILTHLNHGYFLSETVAAIYRTVDKMFRERVTISRANIEESLKADGTVLESDYIEDLLTESGVIVYPSDIKFHATRIRNAWMLRQSMALFSYASTAAQKGRRTANDLVAEVAGQLMELMDSGSDQTTMETSRKGMMDVRRRLEHPEVSANQKYMPTGIPWLDEIIVGLAKGELIFLAGRPGHAKTAFSLHMAERMSKQIGKDEAIVYFSIEMKNNNMHDRRVARMAQVNSKLLIHGYNGMSTEEALRVNAAIEDIEERNNIYFDEKTAPTAQYIMSKVMAINARTPVRAVFLDYLELVGLAQDEKRYANGNKVLAVETVILALKAIAKALNIPIIVLSQLKRDVEERATLKNPPRPRSSDLRWSGMAEQTANQIILLSHPWRFMQSGISYRQAPPKRFFEVFVTKNRDGDVGSKFVKFVQEYGYFDDDEWVMEEEPEPEKKETIFD